MTGGWSDAVHDDFAADAKLVIEEDGQLFENQEKKLHFLCSTGSNCVLLSNCRIILQLMDKSCLLPEKLRELTCGYQGDEPLVCCPNGGYHSITNRPRPGRSCGQPHLHNWWSSEYKGVGSQPWVVRVSFKNKLSGVVEQSCCGSIISPTSVLTAAHCALAKQETHKLHSVRVGEYDATQDPDCTDTFCGHRARDVRLSHVIVHPGYEPTIFRHNVAILVLKTPLNYSVTVQPICLHESVNTQLVGRSGKLVGWGKLPGQIVTPGRQQQVNLPIQPLDRCTKVYSSVIPVSTNQLCVGGEEKMDACSGFGGAPLVILSDQPQPRYYQVGIVSFGSDKCGTTGVPSVYTRVDQYAEWIKQNSPQV